MSVYKVGHKFLSVPHPIDISPTFLKVLRLESRILITHSFYFAFNVFTVIKARVSIHVTTFVDEISSTKKFLCKSFPFYNYSVLPDDGCV
jgi:hypothetical protein